MDKKVKKKAVKVNHNYKIINIATCFNSQNREVEVYALTECKKLLKQQSDKWVCVDDNLKDYNGN